MASQSSALSPGDAQRAASVYLCQPVVVCGMSDEKMHGFESIVDECLSLARRVFGDEVGSAASKGISK